MSDLNETEALRKLVKSLNQQGQQALGNERVPDATVITHLIHDNGEKIGELHLVLHLNKSGPCLTGYYVDIANRPSARFEVDKFQEFVTDLRKSGMEVVSQINTLEPVA